MGQDRFTGIVLLYACGDIELNPIKIVDRFTECKICKDFML